MTRQEQIKEIQSHIKYCEIQLFLLEEGTMEIEEYIKTTQNAWDNSKSMMHTDEYPVDRDISYE